MGRPTRCSPQQVQPTAGAAHRTSDPTARRSTRGHTKLARRLARGQTCSGPRRGIVRAAAAFVFFFLNDSFDPICQQRASGARVRRLDREPRGASIASHAQPRSLDAASLDRCSFFFFGTAAIETAGRPTTIGCRAPYFSAASLIGSVASDPKGCQKRISFLPPKSDLIAPCLTWTA
jgi:hypothetical protein